MTVEERAARLAQEIGLDSGAFLGEYEPKIADALRAAAQEVRQEALEEAVKVALRVPTGIPSTCKQREEIAGRIRALAEREH